MLFHHHRQIPLRRAALILGDVIGIAGSIVLAAVIRLHGIEGEWLKYLSTHVASLSTIGFIFLTVFYAGGMYERESLTRKRNCTVLPAITVIIAMVLSMVMFYARFEMTIGRGILLLAGVLIFLSSSSLRYLYRLAVGFGFLSRNALIVGQGKVVKEVVDLLRGTEDSGFKVFGIVSVSASRKGEFLHGVPILGTIKQLREFVAAYEIETLIVATSMDREPALLRALRPLRYGGIELLDFVSLHEVIAQEIPLDHIDDEWLMSAAMNSSVVHTRQIKRTLDIVVSLVGLVVTFPICLLAALLVKSDSKGPVLYRQRRTTRDGKPYTLLKFRTMHKDAELESGAVWADKADARVTRTGKFLRKWRIDEIPQLLNVLKGEMSLVGPRPERPEFIETLADQIPFYKERLLVLPGITGWAQIKFPYAASIDASRRKLQYDLYYNKHMGLLLDIQILLRTFRTIIEGIRHSDDAGMEKDEPAAPTAPTKPLTVLPPTDHDDEQTA